MTDTTHPDDLPDVPWPTGERRLRAPDTSMLPGTEKTQPDAVGTLRRVADVAHGAVDRMADSAEPRLRQMADGVAEAETAVRAGVDRMSQTGQAWADSLRGSVRSHPIAAVATAVALGVVVARLTR